MRTPSTVAAALALAAASSVLAQPAPSIGPQIRIDTGASGSAANETTASVSPVNPNHIIAGWNDWRESFGGTEIIRSGFSLSLNGGQTWNDFLLRPPVPNQSSVEGDPMSGFNPRDGKLWAGAISFSGSGGIYVARKNTGDPLFQASVMADAAGGTDKCWMAAGPRPGEPSSTRLYVTYNFGVIWSDDFGDTWTDPNSIASGIGFLPRVGPDGELYVAYWDFGDDMKLARSLDGGQTFVTRTIATRMDTWSTQDGSRFGGTFRVPPLVYIAVDPNDGRLFAVYFDTTNIVGGDANVDLYFTHSDDQGDTWTTPVVINGDGAPPGDQFFPWLEVDARGRLHLLFFDSRSTPVDDGDVDGMFDAYYAYSFNRGATWHEHRLTPQSWNSDDDGLDRPQQFIGDYLGMAVSNDRAHPVYIDTQNGDPDVYTHVIEFPPPGDVDGNGIVEFQDLLAVLSNWGPCPGPDPCAADLNGDGVIDFQDLLIVASNWS